MKKTVNVKSLKTISVVYQYVTPLETTLQLVNVYTGIYR